MNRYVPTKKPAKKKEPTKPWEAWNKAHPELVCSEAACPHNRQTVERRQTKVWVVLHQLSHGHSTFTAETLADYAGCTLAMAEITVKIGCDWKLCMLVDKTPEPTRPGQTPKGRPVYARFAKPPGMKAAPSKAKEAAAFGKASAQLWGSS